MQHSVERMSADIHSRSRAAGSAGDRPDRRATDLADLVYRVAANSTSPFKLMLDIACGDVGQILRWPARWAGRLQPGRQCHHP
jgi:hypothetical protein